MGMDCSEPGNDALSPCATDGCEHDALRVARYSKHHDVIEQLNELQWPDASDQADSMFEKHVFDAANRCIRCDVEHLDAAIYDGLAQCPGKQEDQPIVYTTSTGGEPVCSHPIDP